MGTQSPIRKKRYHNGTTKGPIKRQKAFATFLHSSVRLCDLMENG